MFLCFDMALGPVHGPVNLPSCTVRSGLVCVHPVHCSTYIHIHQHCIALSDTCQPLVSIPWMKAVRRSANKDQSLSCACSLRCPRRCVSARGVTPTFPWSTWTQAQATRCKCSLSERAESLLSISLSFLPLKSLEQCRAFSGSSSAFGIDCSRHCRGANLKLGM